MNILLQGSEGLFSACFCHAGSFHDGEENSTVAENDCDLLNEPDLSYRMCQRDEGNEES